MSLQMRIPDIAEISEFFGVEPVEQSPEDGYWCYEVTDRWGAQVRFSFNIYERSVQTVVSSQGRQIVSVAHEQADELALQSASLRCIFSSESSKTTLTLQLEDGASVTWSTLRTL
jgi:acetolactate synthase regulatory subunit